MKIRRRHILSSAAMAAMSAASPAQALKAKSPSTFVLVHGAWHGAWCYRRVADRLQAQGHRVFVPTLTGLAERAHLAAPGVNLSTHIADVVNLIKWEELRDIVLVGHSYGGMVISGVAEKVAPGIIRAIVFLDAFVPENGKCLNDYAPPTLPEALEQLETGFIPPFPAAGFNVNAKDRTWVDAQCTPQPARTFAERLTMTGAREKIPKKLYVLATGWRGPFHQFAERLRSDSSWTVREIAAGHDVMLDAPDQVVRLLKTMT